MKDVALNKEFDINGLFRKLGIVSFKLKESGIPSIKNRDTILRSLADNQNIKPLHTLVNVSKPVKNDEVSFRYKPFWPYVTYSDACKINPPEAVKFNNSVAKLISTANRQQHKMYVISVLEKWIFSYKRFRKLKSNVNLSELKPQFKNLYIVAKHLKILLELGAITDAKLEEMNISLKKLKTPFAQAEIEVITGLEQLRNFALSNKNEE